MLAGQPQDPWQPSEQDQAPPGWQSYSPPAAENPDTYAYRQSGAAAQGYGQQGGYGQQAGYAAPPYTSQDQAFTAQDQAFGDQAYQSQAAGPQGQQAHWQAVSGMTQAGRKPKAGGKGFLGSLFDFSFTSFVTPKIIKVLYVLATVWTVIWALVFLRYGFKYGGAAGGFATLIIVDPILIVLTLGAFRMVLELFMVAHRMHEDLRAIRDRGEG
jgi:uncharacterized membrane protein